MAVENSSHYIYVKGEQGECEACRGFCAGKDMEKYLMDDGVFEEPVPGRCAFSSRKLWVNPFDRNNPCSGFWLPLIQSKLDVNSNEPCQVYDSKKRRWKFDPKEEFARERLGEDSL